MLQQTLACSILTALLSEFSSSSKTSSIGLSMEFHGSCKRLFQVCSSLHHLLVFTCCPAVKLLMEGSLFSFHFLKFSHRPLLFLLCITFYPCIHPFFSSSSIPHFQEESLRQIFMLTMEVLQEFSRRENLNAQMSSVFQRYLALANQVLSWNFLPPNHILSLSEADRISYTWKGQDNKYISRSCHDSIILHKYGEEKQVSPCYLLNDTSSAVFVMALPFSHVGIVVIFKNCGLLQSNYV